MTFEEAIRKSIREFYAGAKFEETALASVNADDLEEDEEATPSFVYDQSFFDQLEEDLEIGDIEIPEDEEDDAEVEDDEV